MLIDLVCLRANGLRLRKDELEVPVRGDLVVADNDGRGMAIKRPSRVAHVFRYVGSPAAPQDVVRSLHDVQVLRIDGAVITILGTETHAIDGGLRAAEHGQVWRCTLVT